MPNVKLTKRTVDAAAIDGRGTFFWDDDLRGYGFKVTPAGTETYLIQYRMGGRGTANRRYTIGRHGTWTCLSPR